MADEDLSEETAIKLNMSLDELIVTHNHFNEKSYKNTNSTNKGEKNVNNLISNNLNSNKKVSNNINNIKNVVAGGGDNANKNNNYALKKSNFNKKNVTAKNKNSFISNSLSVSSCNMMTPGALSGAPPPPPPKVPPPPVTQVAPPCIARPVDMYLPNHLVASSSLQTCNPPIMPPVGLAAPPPISNVPPPLVVSTPPAAPPPPMSTQPSPPAVPCPPGTYGGGGNIVPPPVYTPPPPPITSSTPQTHPHMQSSYALPEDTINIQSLNPVPAHFTHAATPAGGIGVGGMAEGDANKRSVLRSANDRQNYNLSQLNQIGGPPTPRLRPSSTSASSGPHTTSFPQGMVSKEMMMMNANVKSNNINIHLKNPNEKYPPTIGYPNSNQREYINEVRPSRSLILRDAPHAVIGAGASLGGEGDSSQQQMSIRANVRASPGGTGASPRAAYGRSPPVQQVRSAMPPTAASASTPSSIPLSGGVSGSTGRVVGSGVGSGMGSPVGPPLSFPSNSSNLNVPYNTAFTPSSSTHAHSVPPNSFYNSNTAGGGSGAGGLNSANQSHPIGLGGNRRPGLADGVGVGIANSNSYNHQSSHGQVAAHGGSGGGDLHNNNRFVNNSNKYVARYANSNDASSTYVRTTGGGGADYINSSYTGGGIQGSPRGGSWGKDCSNPAVYRGGVGNSGGGTIDVRRGERIVGGVSSLKRDRAAFENSDIPYALSSAAVGGNRGGPAGEVNDYYNNYNHNSYANEASNLAVARGGGGRGGICVNERDTIDETNSNYNWNMNRRMINHDNLTNRDEIMYYNGRVPGSSNNSAVGGIGGGFHPSTSACSTYGVNEGNYMNVRDQMKQADIQGDLGGRVKDARGGTTSGRRLLGVGEDVWCGEGNGGNMRTSSEKEERIRCGTADGGIGMGGAIGSTKVQQLSHPQARASSTHTSGGGGPKGEWGSRGARYNMDTVGGAGAGKAHPGGGNSSATSSLAAAPSNRSILEANNKTKSMEGYNVIVTNVPHNLTAMEIQEAFSCLGSVIRTDVMLTSHGEHTGRVCVMYASKSAAEEAVCRFDGGDLNGNTIRVFQE